MQILINTDHHIEGHEALATWATGEVKNALSHHSDQITRVELHISDENGHKSSSNDKRCVMETHLQGRPPMVVTQHAETLYLAVTGAGEKLNRMIEGTLGRAARTEALPD